MTSHLITPTFADIAPGWAILWIIVALIVLFILYSVYRFSPDLVRYMRIKRM